MAEAEESGGEKLEAAEPLVHFVGALAAYDPACKNRDKNGEEQADYGREKNEKDRLGPTGEDQRLESRVSDGCAAVAAHQRVRRTGGQAEGECNQVPGNGAEQAGEQKFFVHRLNGSHAAADGFIDLGAEDKRRDEIPESPPEHGAEGRADARGDD